MLRKISARKVGEGTSAPHQLQPHADAGERRAQLVRGALASRDLCDFTRVSIRSADALNWRARSATSSLPGVGHAHRQVAVAKLLHAALQGFSAAGVSRRMTGYRARATAGP